MASHRLLAFLACGVLALAGCTAPGNATEPPGGAGDGAAPGAGGGDGGAGAGSSAGGTMPAGTGPTGSAAATGTGAQGNGVTYDVGRAVHEAAWLCQTPVVVDDLTPAGTDDQQCKVTLTFTDTTVTVASTGIPNHDYESGGGCCAKTRSLTNTFPLRPQMAASSTAAPERGAIAIAVNGAQVFGPEDADDADVVIVTYSSPTAQPRLELCDAHSAPQDGAFHYHADANCIHWHAGAGQTMADYDFSKVDATQHAKIVAFAPDGFPIYGSYGYAADGVTVKEITSSYRLKAGATGSAGIDDQEYVPGLGDLDECNGRTSPTPEFPDGIYHYYSTKHNGEGDWGFPYFPLCYKGVVAASGAPTGGMTGGMGGSTGGNTASGTGGPGGGGMPPSGSMTGTSSCPPPPGPGQPPPSTPPPPGCGPPPP